MGDIGSHWMDMIQHLTGLKITSLCADLAIFHKTRKKPKFAVETFAGKTLRPDDYDQIKIDTDDYGAVLLRLGDRARGAFTVSQTVGRLQEPLPVGDLRHQGRRSSGTRRGPTSCGSATATRPTS